MIASHLGRSQISVHVFVVDEITHHHIELRMQSQVRTRSQGDKIEEVTCSARARGQHRTSRIRSGHGR